MKRKILSYIVVSLVSAFAGMVWYDKMMRQEYMLIKKPKFNFDFTK